MSHQLQESGASNLAKRHESGYARLYVQPVARIWVLKSCHKAINDLFRVSLTLLPKCVPLPG